MQIYLRLYTKTEIDEISIEISPRSKPANLDFKSQENPESKGIQLFWRNYNVAV